VKDFLHVNYSAEDRWNLLKPTASKTHS